MANTKTARGISIMLPLFGGDCEYDIVRERCSMLPAASIEAAGRFRRTVFSGDGQNTNVRAIRLPKADTDFRRGRCGGRGSSYPSQYFYYFLPFQHSTPPGRTPIAENTLNPIENPVTSPNSTSPGFHVIDSRLSLDAPHLFQNPPGMIGTWAAVEMVHP